MGRFGILRPLLLYSPLLRAAHRPTPIHMHMAMVLIGVALLVALRILAFKYKSMEKDVKRFPRVGQ